MKKKFLYILVFILVFVFSCNDSREHREKPRDWKKIDEQMIEVNKYLVNKDQATIKNYIAAHNWNMQKSDVGFWYEIYEIGNGKKVENNDTVSIKYSVELLDGTLCYSSDSLGVKSFIVGKAQIETGIQQGIKLLTKGSKARFILPPYLAHGLAGDKNRIPPRSIIVYNIELVD